MADPVPGAAPALSCELLYGIGTPDASGHCPHVAASRLTGTLALVVLRAVATAAAVAACGAVLALRGVLGADAQRFLAYLSLRVTIPALLFHASATAVTPQLLASAWPLALLPFAYVPLGLALGELVVRATRPPPATAAAVRAACALGNSTGLPVVLLTVISDALITPAARDAYGPRLQPLAYLPLYLLTYPMLQWGVGGMLFGLRSGEGGSTAAAPRPQQLLPLSGGGDAAAAEAPPDAADAEEDERQSLLQSSSLSVPPPPPAPAPLPARLKALAAAARAELLPQLASPPALASLAGAVVGLSPRQLRLLPALSAAASPLGWVLGAAQQLGAAAVPVNLMLLGASLVAAVGGGGISALLAAAGGPRTAAGVVLAKLVVAPLGAAVLCAALRRCLPPLAEPYDDSVALVALLVAATPTANNVLVMALAAGPRGGGEEARRAVAALLAAQALKHAAAPALLTLSVSAALALIAVRV